MCERVGELFSQGASMAEICLELDICFQTWRNWQQEHPEFLEAVKRGEDKSRGWWEKNGRVALREKDFNYTGWYMNMKNRFRKDWVEQKEVIVKDDIERKDLKSLNDQDLESYVSKITEA